MPFTYQQCFLVTLLFSLVYLYMWVSWYESYFRNQRIILHRMEPIKWDDSYLMEMPAHHEVIPEESITVPPTTTPPTLKKILFWTPFNGHEDFNFGFGREAFLNSHCAIDTCETTNNKNELESSDAVLFHLNSIQSRKELPGFRDPKQYWVVVNGESPHYANQLPLDGVFNLTMTYYSDADIPFPKGKLVPLSFSERSTYFSKLKKKNIIGIRNKMAVWYVKQCNTPSQRELLVTELKKYIDVDVYGDCGPMKCARSDYECDKEFALEYKFYLALEKSLCKEYVTETLWRPLSLGALPVVMGGLDYSELLPPNSYIDVANFSSVEELAKFLQKLARNDTLYSEYFQWRSDFNVQGMRLSESFCSLCEYLHNKEDFSKPAINYSSIHHPDKECSTPLQYFSHMKQKQWLQT